MYACRPQKGTFVNFVDPDLMPQNSPSDQALRCLHSIQEILHVNKIASSIQFKVY